jgi:predicted metallo-beta-lactamase superfamily hydrolase
MKNSYSRQTCKVLFLARTLEKIVGERPQLVMVGGPPSYLAGFRVDEEHFRLGMSNLGENCRIGALHNFGTSSF